MSRLPDPIATEFFGILRTWFLLLVELEAKARQDLLSGSKSAGASLIAIAKANDIILAAARDMATEKIEPQKVCAEMHGFYTSLEALKR
jgi:hypothetical protein